MNADVGTDGARFCNTVSDGPQLSTDVGAGVTWFRNTVSH